MNRVNTGLSNNRFILCVSLFLLTFASSLSAQSQVVYLGSTPRDVSSLPRSIADSADFGFDQDRNYYFLDGARQNVFLRTAKGAERTVLSGLMNASLSVDWNGDLAVADSGHHRILFQQRDTPQPREYSLPLSRSPKGILLGKEEKIFFLSGSTLYTMPEATGLSNPVAEIPGAMALANGPDTPQGHSVYILSYLNNAYQAKIYTYKATSGALNSASQSVPVQGRVSSFQVAPSGEYLVRTTDGTVALVSKAGDFYQLDSSNGSNAGVAMDRMNRFDYIDGNTVKEIQFGRVDLGSAAVQQHNEYIGGWLVRYGQPQGSNAFQSFRVKASGPFFASQNYEWVPGDLLCSIIDPNSYCEIYISMVTSRSGTLLGTLESDSGSVPILGTATSTGLHPLQTNGPSSDFPHYPGIQQPSYLATNPQSRTTFVLDAPSGNLYLVSGDTPQLVRSDLEKTNGMGIDLLDNLYVTQSGVPGVMRITPDKTVTQLATEIMRPVGVAADRWGNVYVGSESGAIYKVWIADGSVALLADAGKKVSAANITSLTTDRKDYLYAAFADGGSSGHGALVKISPAGAVSEITAKFSRIVGLSTDLGGNLYMSDAGSKSLQLLTLTGRQYSLLSGLGEPVGVAAVNDGVFAVADKTAGVLRAPSSAPWGFDFSRTPLGVTKNGFRIVLNSGNQAGGAFLGGSEYGDPGFTQEDTGIIQPGDAGALHYTFTPESLGPANYRVDVFSHEENFPDSTAYLTGVGVDH